MTTIEIPTPDGNPEAYVARPEQSSEFPGVLFFMDVIGLRPRIREMADWIASWGYVVLVPNLLYRSGSADQTSPTTDLRGPGAREAFFAQAKPRLEPLDGAAMERDIPAYLSALRGLDGVRAGAVGVVGYCMGARYAVRAAGLDQAVAAAAGFHGGRLVTDADDSPHTRLRGARAEFLFGHADNDASMPPEAVEALAKALDDAGLQHTNEVYPDAPHGYSMSDTSMFDEAATERSFTELHALLDRTLR